MNLTKITVKRNLFTPKTYHLSVPSGFVLTMQRKIVDLNRWVVQIDNDVRTLLTAVEAEMVASSMATIMGIKQESAYQILIETIGGKPWQFVK